jgi:hypothetical protein
MDLCAARGNTDYVLPCFSIKYSNGGFVIGARLGIGVRSGNRGSLRKLHNDGY